MLRGDATKKKIEKSKKTLEVGGWVMCPIGNKNKLENIFYTLFYYVFGRAFERR